MEYKSNSIQNTFLTKINIYPYKIYLEYLIEINVILTMDVNIINSNSGFPILINDVELATWL